MFDHVPLFILIMHFQYNIAHIYYNYQKHSNGTMIATYANVDIIMIFDYIENLYSCRQIISLCYGEQSR